jgi:hypothetical protein
MSTMATSFVPLALLLGSRDNGAPSCEVAFVPVLPSIADCATVETAFALTKTSSSRLP